MFPLCLLALCCTSVLLGCVCASVPPTTNFMVEETEIVEDFFDSMFVFLFSMMILGFFLLSLYRWRTRLHRSSVLAWQQSTSALQSMRENSHGLVLAVMNFTRAVPGLQYAVVLECFMSAGELIMKWCKPFFETDPPAAAVLTYSSGSWPRLSCLRSFALVASASS